MSVLLRHSIAATVAVLAATSAAGAQTTTAARDTTTLAALRRAARAHDPRVRQLELLSQQSRLRLANIDAERKPSFTVESQAQYQSDVTTIPVTLPSGMSIPTPPHDTYDAHLATRYNLYDATIAPRREVERAQTLESRARVNTTLYTRRQNVDDAFFAVLRADAQRAEVETSIADLDAQITVAAARVREGTALPSEENVLRAERLRRRQTISELNASRTAALDVLIDLTGNRDVATSVFTLPDIPLDSARAEELVANPRARPEFEQFARTRNVLERQREARRAQDKPRVSAFGRVGYGRPGLNQLSNSFDTYWLAGVQAQWTPRNWGATDRDREVLTLQERIVAADEQAFTESLRRAARQDIATIARLQRELANDDEIIALRERVLAEARARFAEAVITSAELVDRETDVLAARLTRSTHRVELAQARACLLTTLGIDTP